MFETTLLPRPAASRLRWTILFALTLQAGTIAAFVVGPLLYPETLPAFVALKAIPLATYHPLPKPQTVRLERVATPSSAPTTPHAAITQAQPQSQTQPHGGMLSHAPAATLDEPAIAVGGGSGNLFALGSGNGPTLTPGPPVTVVAAAPAAPKGPIRLSSGVTAGLLLAPIQPAYPAIAKAAHVQGTVVLTCTIDKTGRIQGLQVVSGPDLLRTSAINAVSVARYKPYKLNGEPTEVITTISVSYHIDGSTT